MSGRTYDRRDRYTTKCVWDWAKPKSILKNSNFLKLYKDFDMDELDSDKVWWAIHSNWESGGKRVDGIFKEISDAYSLEEKCIKLWTMESPCYHILTQSLYEDNYEEIKRYMPIIRGMNKYIVTPTKKEYTCYRGSKMSKKMWDYYKEGNEYRAPSFGAMSQNIETCERFKDEYRILFKIPKNCWNAAPVKSYLTPFPSEEEVLMPPYTAFKVLKKWNGLKELEVQVLDNKQVSEYASSAFI